MTVPLQYVVLVFGKAYVDWLTVPWDPN